jgi:hypothetical protein
MTPRFPTPTPESRKWLKADRIGLAAFALVVICMFPSVGGATSAKVNGGGRKPPTSTALPTISGNAVVGQTLTASTGSWSGGVSAYAYQWLRCASSGGCALLTGAVSASYVPASGDSGYTLRVSVTASNNAGSTVATSNPTSTVTTLGAPPANTSPPTASGTTQVGKTLSGSTGTWTGSPSSYAYQWHRCDSAGGSCTDISGATSSSYVLQSADSGSTVRVAVTATNSAGSASASSSQTTMVTTSGSGSGYPASFFTGPAGTNNILPPNGSYPSTGAWMGEVSGNSLTQVSSREQYLGRRFNIVSMYAQNRCDPWPTVLAATVSAGYIPMVSWFPTPAYADQIISGQADSCIKSFGNAIANQSGRVLVRPYWEFNGGWYPYSKNSDGSRATADQEKQMWQHTIDVLRTTNFFAKASVVWSPHEGYYNNGDAWNNPTPYPGDTYVDWVGSDYYNHNLSTAWCGFQGAGWCNFGQMFTHGYYAPAYTPRGVEYSFRGRKPYMVGETGSVEDSNTPGRKSQWMIDMGNYAKTYMPGLYALVYFDVNYSTGAWNLDSSTSSMDGFKSFVSDPYFNVPNQ